MCSNPKAHFRVLGQRAARYRVCSGPSVKFVAVVEWGLCFGFRHQNCLRASLSVAILYLLKLKVIMAMCDVCTPDLFDTIVCTFSTCDFSLFVWFCLSCALMICACRSLVVCSNKRCLLPFRSSYQWAFTFSDGISKQINGLAVVSHE